MNLSHKNRFFLLVIILLACSITLLPAQAAPSFANNSFRDLWQYSDKLVDEIPGAGRGFTWGPNSFGILQEDYLEGAGGKRPVQYFDKSRMELAANGQFVTNGLLTKELVTGQRQDGDSKFTSVIPSTVQVAGDDNSSGGNAISPTYASFKQVVSFNPGENRADNRANGPVNLVIDKAGNVTNLPIGQGTATIQTTIADYQEVLGHNIPRAFYDFANQTARIWNGSAYVTGKVFTDNPTAKVFGYAITEPYWMKAVVAGEQKDIMVQLYERRVLTYTPSNPAAFQVEMGNIGQHYYSWRYGSASPLPTPTPTTQPTPTPTSAPAGNLPASGCLAAVSTSGNTVQACVSNPSPSQNSNVTVYGRLIVGGKAIGGVNMDTTWNYKTTTSYCSGTTDGNGVASCTRGISRASKGYSVYISINFSYNGQSYSGSTSFTPQ